MRRNHNGDILVLQDRLFVQSGLRIMVWNGERRIAGRQARRVDSPS